MKQTFTISLAGNPNSCIVKIGNTRLRSLVDTSADISLINKRIWQNIKNKPKLIRDRPCIKSVSGDSFKIEGCSKIEFKIGNLTLIHKFYIVEGINRNMILGRE
jgi:hypothetical protein